MLYVVPILYAARTRIPSAYAPPTRPPVLTVLCCYAVLVPPDPMLLLVLTCATLLSDPTLLSVLSYAMLLRAGPAAYTRLRGPSDMGPSATCTGHDPPT